MAGAAGVGYCSGGTTAGETGASREQRLGTQPDLVSGGAVAYAVRALHDCRAGDSRGAQEMSGAGSLVGRGLCCVGTARERLAGGCCTSAGGEKQRGCCDGIKEREGGDQRAVGVG